MNRLVSFFALAFAFPLAHVVAAVAPTHRDLGRNLAYQRIHTLPADLPITEATRKQPWVLDLRYTPGDATAANALQAWIRFQATTRTPIFILANPETERALVTPFLGRNDPMGVIVIGRAGGGFAPNIAIQSSAADERRAYDAFEAGAEVTALISENAGKSRNDEASLSRDRASEPRPDSVTPNSKEPSPPVDTALQRAVHLHRALLALKKL